MSCLPEDGKYEVIFPVAVPDEGTFDWLDDFLEKNPKYVELPGLKWFRPFFAVFPGLVTCFCFCLFSLSFFFLGGEEGGGVAKGT